jgi:hypothetical protein
MLEAMWSATRATFQGDGSRNKWELDGGKDLDGDELTVVVEFSEDVGARVVTAF